jgi:hypothetical protein
MRRKKYATSRSGDVAGKERKVMRRKKYATSRSGDVAEKQEVRNVPFRRHCWERKIDHIGMMTDIALHEKFGIDKSDAKKEVRNVPFRRRC